MESFLWRKKCYPWQLKFTSSSPLPRFLSRKGCVFLPWLDSEVRKQSQAALLAEKTEHTQRRAQHSRKDEGRLLLSMPCQRFSPSTCFHFLPLHLPDLLRGSHIFIHCSGPCRLPADLQGWKAGPLAARVSLVTAQSLAGGPCCEQPCWATALPKLRLWGLIPTSELFTGLAAHNLCSDYTAAHISLLPILLPFLRPQTLTSRTLPSKLAPCTLHPRTWFPGTPTCKVYVKTLRAL